MYLIKIFRGLKLLFSFERRRRGILNPGGTTPKNSLRLTKKTEY